MRGSRCGYIRNIFTKASAFNSDAVAVYRCGKGNNIKVDRSGKRKTVVVVGMVARKLGPAGGRKESNVKVAVIIKKIVCEGQNTFTARRNTLARVERENRIIETAVIQFFDQHADVHKFFLP